jgi:regulatory factor X 1/2/3
VAAVNAFSQTLRRYTSLNHLAQAARAVLHNPPQITQMLADLNRVDFHNIQEKEQVELYKTKQKKENFECRCNPEFRWPGWKNDFKITLPYNLKPHWNSAGVQWLERESSSIVSSNLWKADQPRNFVRVARQFLLKWVVCQVQQQQPIN